MSKRFDTTLRESIGLILLVAGVAIAPMGWLSGGGVLSVAVLLVSVGIWMFYTQRIRLCDMAARLAEAEALEREAEDTAVPSAQEVTDAQATEPGKSQNVPRQ